MKTISLNVRAEWEPILRAAAKVIDEVMTAGEAQRLKKGRPTNEWMTYPLDKRHWHALKHLVEGHTGNHPNPFILAEDTGVEQYKHAAVGLMIIAAVDSGLTGVPTVDSREAVAVGE